MNSVARVALALAAALVIGACAREKQVVPPDERVPVTTIVVKEESVPREISCFGTITFLRKIDLSATVDGTVARIFVKEGQSVREGQNLLTLKNVQLELRRQQALSGIDSARSSLDLAQAKLWEGELAVEARQVAVQRTELEREQKRLEVEDAAQTLANKEELSKVGGVTAEALSAVRLRLLATRNEYAMIEKDLISRRIGLRDEDLQREGLIPAVDPTVRTRQLVQLNTKTLRAEVEAARARYESARRELEASEELLKALAIDAPAPGIVGAKYVEQGEYVAQNGKLLTLMDTKNVYAALSVQESEMPLLQEGMPCRPWMLFPLNRSRAEWIPSHQLRTPRPALSWSRLPSPMPQASCVRECSSVPPSPMRNRACLSWSPKSASSRKRAPQPRFSAWSMARHSSGRSRSAGTSGDRSPQRRDLQRETC